MASELPIKTSKLMAPDRDSIKEMIHIYQEAYKHDQTIQLQYILPSLIERMAEIISDRCTKPECEFIVARTEPSNRIIGWTALAFKLKKNKQISEEHVLLTQYALLPDIAAKCKNEGIGTAQLKTLSHKVLSDFKSARENQLPDKHCIISTLVVDPSYQRKGVASALLSKAITRTEVFSFPIWVQAPSAQQTLISKHDFEEVSEYRIDLNEHVPEPDNKGKTKAASSLGAYAWKFMIRQKPLEKALKAYKSSKVYAEEEEERRVDERRRHKRLTEGEQSQGAKASAKKSGAPKPEDLLLGGNVQTAAGGESLVARDDEEEAGPSTPLLKKFDSEAKGKGKRKEKLIVQATRNAARKNAVKEVQDS